MIYLSKPTHYLSAFILGGLLLIGGGYSASAQEVAGVIATQSGQATRTPASNTDALPISAGSPVMVGDRLETGPDGRLVIRFLDQSALTLSANAEVVIDALVFSRDPADQADNKQDISLLNGVYHYLSGTIGSDNRDDVSLRTPVATIGIRGTEFVGGELTVGMSAGTSHIGFQIREGAILVENEFGSVSLDEPGEGTFIPMDGSKAPTSVRQWTPAEAAEADALLGF